MAGQITTLSDQGQAQSEGSVLPKKGNGKKPRVPIWEKANLTLEEAAAYSSIGINKLRDITNENGCDFVLFIGTKRLIKRKKFDAFLEGRSVL